MARLFLACALCFAVALLGVCGTHAHVRSLSHHSLDGDPVHVVNVVDADHSAEHDDDDIDIDPVVKAFGQFLLQAPVLLLAWCLGVLPFIAREVWKPRPERPLLRPPKERRHFYLLPPAHAPPTLLA